MVCGGARELEIEALNVNNGGWHVILKYDILKCSYLACGLCFVKTRLPSNSR